MADLTRPSRPDTLKSNEKDLGGPVLRTCLANQRATVYFKNIGGIPMQEEPTRIRPGADWPDRLLAHYQTWNRELPWRQTRDPYAIYVSEIMLQQTQVQTVIPYYERFMARFPDLESLASADPDELHKYWEGLGYYSRVRLMQTAAKQMVSIHGARVPSDREQLRSLPGIGTYTVGALLSIAYGQAVPAVDGNVVRVVSRLFGLSLTQGSPADRDRVAAMIEPLIPRSAPGDFNQALMEFGALICTPAAPRCQNCPLRDDCVAFHQDQVTVLPLKPQKKAVKTDDYTVVIVKSGSQYRVQRRQEDLLRGLYQFDLLPGRLAEAELLDWLASEFPECYRKTDQPHEDSVKNPAVFKLSDRTHRFTHRIWQMSGYLVTLDWLPFSPDTASSPDPDPFIWVRETELMSLPFPTALAAYREDALRSLPTGSE